jgi:hypothetical protein
LFHSSLIKEQGLKVNELNCFKKLIILLNESNFLDGLKFKIDYFKEQIVGQVKAKVYFNDYF